MTFEPPFETPSLHVNLIKYALVELASFIKLMGESGTDYMKAPFPAVDYSDSP
jgi:hypothetical protein